MTHHQYIINVHVLCTTPQIFFGLNILAYSVQLYAPKSHYGGNGECILIHSFILVTVLHSYAGPSGLAV